MRSRALREADRLAYGFLAERGRRLETMTYGELAAAAAGLATGLQTRSAAGEVVGLLLPPGLEFVRVFFACLLAGRIALPLPLPRREEEVAACAQTLRQAGARLVVTTPGRSGELMAGFPEDLRACALEAGGLSEEGAHRPDGGSEIAYLQYTSGTTGAPRGVIVEHAALMANSEAIRRAFDHGPTSVGVIWLPHYHDMGLVGGIIQPLFAGFPVYLMPPADVVRAPRSWLEAISRFRATTSGGPNFVYDMCASRITDPPSDWDLSSWRVAFTGAEPVSMSTLEAFSDRFAPSGFSARAFTPCYGMAEATLMVTSCSPEDPPQAAEAARGGKSYVDCGPPISETEVRIVDPERGVEIGAGEVGEVWIRGPGLTRGYWRAEAPTGALWGELHDERHLRTGDLGFLKGGRLHICGRLKSVFIARGVNHNLEDIERSAPAREPRLAGYVATAFGWPTAERERLVVVQEAPPRLRSAGDSGAVVAAIREAIVAEHGVAPDEVVLVPQGWVPRTSSGKPRREACREKAVREALV